MVVDGHDEAYENFQFYQTFFRFYSEMEFLCRFNYNHYLLKLIYLPKANFNEFFPNLKFSQIIFNWKWQIPQIEILAVRKKCRRKVYYYYIIIMEGCRATKAMERKDKIENCVFQTQQNDDAATLGERIGISCTISFVPFFFFMNLIWISLQQNIVIIFLQTPARHTISHSFYDAIQWTANFIVKFEIWWPFCDCIELNMAPNRPN